MKGSIGSIVIAFFGFSDMVNAQTYTYDISEFELCKTAIVHYAMTGVFRNYNYGVNTELFFDEIENCINVASTTYSSYSTDYRPTLEIKLDDILSKEFINRSFVKESDELYVHYRKCGDQYDASRKCPAKYLINYTWKEIEAKKLGTTSPQSCFDSVRAAYQNIIPEIASKDALDRNTVEDIFKRLQMSCGSNTVQLYRSKICSNGTPKSLKISVTQKWTSRSSADIKEMSQDHGFFELGVFCR
ncbi:hypothetical protein [Reinekea sp. G2M2-21]|uniref:hypothetical protein n=1 Tax=Reinekea sp. G2M2-21 TaxID=2788942 RepID=UPI0018A8C944|nr:hypothetical protein [Reinekea sp. G2M2-21]